MARLRKATSPTDPSIILPPPSTTAAPRTRSSSPRKPLRETPSTRELRYTTAQHDLEESSFLVPKIRATGSQGDTPRKQRVLRPVASNSRLLRKLSDESLASPVKERVVGRDMERENGLGYMYSRNLARMARRREKGVERDGKRIGAGFDIDLDMDMDMKIEVKLPIGLQKSVEKQRPTEIQRPVEQTVEDGEEEIAENEEVDTSLWCGNEDEIEKTIASMVEEEQEYREEGQDQEQEQAESESESEPEPEPEQEAESEESDDEDEDPIVDVRNRRRHVPSQPQQHQPSEESESDSDDAEAQILREASMMPPPTFTQPAKKIETVRIPPPEKKALLRDIPAAEPGWIPGPLHRKGVSSISNWAQDVIDLTSSPPTSPKHVASKVVDLTSSPPMSPNDVSAIMTFSPTPTKQRSPRKAPPISRPRTPPPQPESPSKLRSPSKKASRIPDHPDLHPHLDEFWSAEVVNTWNETHSPSKPLLFPGSPRKTKSGSQSPTKKTVTDSSPTVAEVRAQRKAFVDTKHAIAEAFLAEIDSTITNSRVSSMSEPTGGIKIVWSKTLKTTAGRANWKREQIRLRTGPNLNDISIEYRHHCTIELAEKVIDDEERLYNVLAHEYCHLATFLIDEVRNNPHGAEFKAWAVKVSRSFAHKGVEVTTKHSYQIAYKYMWECVICGYEFKRHSKSVDPARHSCGRCKGKLVQTKPTPRASKTADGKPKEKSEYQIFVKENFSKIKKRLESQGKDAQLGKVMGVVAEEYNALKASRLATGLEKGVVEVEDLFEGLRIEDEDV